MVIKVLFFDTSALIKMFINEPGTPNVKWLASSDTRFINSLHLVVNEQVCTEFERKIRYFSNIGKISSVKAEHIINKFIRHYKGKYFSVIGQKIISNTKQETSIDDVIRDLNLREGKDDWDGIIYQSIINALAAPGGESHPILVTCDGNFGKKVESKGYRVINPMKQTIDEIRNVLHSNQS